MLNLIKLQEYQLDWVKNCRFFINRLFFGLSSFLQQSLDHNFVKKMHRYSNFSNWSKLIHVWVKLLGWVEGDLLHPNTFGKLTHSKETSKAVNYFLWKKRALTRELQVELIPDGSELNVCPVSERRKKS